MPAMNPVEEDLDPAEAEVTKNSVKPAPDPDKIILRKCRDKESKKEQRRYYEWLEWPNNILISQPAPIQQQRDLLVVFR